MIGRSWALTAARESATSDRTRSHPRSGNAHDVKASGEVRKKLLDGRPSNGGAGLGRTVVVLAVRFDCRSRLNGAGRILLQER